MMKKQKMKKWGDLKRTANAPDCLDCSICLVDYEDDMNVLQLSCHKNHVYHRECFT